MIKILLACLLTIWMPYSAMAWRTDGWPAKYATERPIKELRDPMAIAFPYIVKGTHEKLILVRNRKVGFIVPPSLRSDKNYRYEYTTMEIKGVGTIMQGHNKPVEFNVKSGLTVALQSAPYKHRPKDYACEVYTYCNFNGVEIEMNEMGVPYAIVFDKFRDQNGAERNDFAVITEQNGKLISPRCRFASYHVGFNPHDSLRTVEVGSETMEIAGKKITIEKAYVNPGKVFGLTTSKKGVDFIRRWMKQNHPDWPLGF